MNTTDEPVVLYPRTKLGSFGLVDPHKIHSVSDLDDGGIDVKHASSVESNVKKKPKVIDHVVKEILSKVHLNTSHMSTAEKSEIEGLLSEYVDIFQVKGVLREITQALSMLFIHLITLPLGQDPIDKLHIYRLR
jgi:citrate lyase gamma subunit